MAESTKIARNEQRKLAATFFNNIAVGCVLVALTEHAASREQCALSAVKRTCPIRGPMSASDPIHTCAFEDLLLCKIDL
jgi:hypothetical protein